MPKAAIIKLAGQVQGVGLRYAVYRHAQANNLKGWIRNEKDGTAGCWLQNSEKEIEIFLDWLKKEFGGIEKIDVSWQESDVDFDDFMIKS